MNPFLSELNFSDPSVIARIARNERVANECISLIAKRFRKQSPEQAFENIVNTVGIIAAQVMRDIAEFAGPEMAEATSDLIAYHMGNALSKRGDATK